MLLLALALALSYAFPQTPVHVRSDPTTYEEWLSTLQSRYRDWTPFLEAMGAFNIQDSAWFRVLLALLVFVSLVALGEQVGGSVFPSQARQPAEFYGTPDTVALVSTLPFAEVVTRVQYAIAQRGLWVHTDADTDETFLYGHPRWSAAGAILIHLGALLIAIGLAVNGRWGWQQQGLRLLPGQPAALGPERGHIIEFLDTPTSPDQTTIAVDGHRTAIGRERAIRRGSLVYQLADQGGPLIRVTAARADGSTLDLAYYAVRPQPAAFLYFAFSALTPADQTDYLFIVPDEKLVVRLQWLNPSNDQGQVPHFQQWVFEQGMQAPVGEAQIQPQNGESTTNIGEITYTWLISRYVTVDVASQPGWLPVGVGAALLVMSLLWRLVPRQQIWSLIREDKQAQGQVTVRIRQDRYAMIRYLRRQHDTAWETLRTEIEDAQ